MSNPYELPPSMLRSDVEVAREFGLRDSKAVTHRQTMISDAREIRIQRALDHVAAGWPSEEWVIFVAAQDEFAEVLRRSS